MTRERSVTRFGALEPYEQPFGRLEVRTLQPREREQFALFNQRNLVFPLDALEQEQPPRAAVINEGELINDDSYHGVGVYYDVVLDSGVLRLAQTTWVDPTTEHVHLLLVGCAVDCFTANVEEISVVMESYPSEERAMSATGTGLAWPAHDAGPTPPPGYVSRERDEERRTRKPLGLWDRIKLLLLCAALFGILLANTLDEFEGIITLADAFALTVRSAARLGVVVGVELLRQVHYLVSEHWAGYHAFWTKKVFGGFNRRAAKMNDWNRFRVGRALKIAFYLLVLNFLLAALLDLPATTALLQAPVVFFDYLPLVLQLAFGFFFVILQFVGLFWFLSRGGTEVYFPDDVKTRFTDVWGQDNVLERVRRTSSSWRIPSPSRLWRGRPGGRSSSSTRARSRRCSWASGSSRSRRCSGRRASSRCATAA